MSAADQDANAGTSAVREGFAFDEAALTRWLEANVAGFAGPLSVEQFKGGKEALFGFFVGQTMKAMQGKANPGVVNDLLKKALG